MMSKVNEIKNIFGDMHDDEVIKQALKKNNLSLEEAIMMLMDETKLADLELEVKMANDDKDFVPIIDNKAVE